jgi:hypothetical protein
MTIDQNVDRCDEQHCLLDARFDVDRVKIQWQGCADCPLARRSGNSDSIALATDIPLNISAMRTTAQSVHFVANYVRVPFVGKKPSGATPDLMLVEIHGKIKRKAVELVSKKVAKPVNNELWAIISLQWNPQTAMEWHNIHTQLADASGDTLKKGLENVINHLLEPTPIGGIPAATKLLGKVAFHIASVHISGPFHLIMDLATQMGLLEAAANGKLLDCATLPDALKPLTERLTKQVVAGRIDDRLTPQKSPRDDLPRATRVDPPTTRRAPQSETPVARAVRLGPDGTPVPDDVAPDPTRRGGERGRRSGRER